MALGRQGLLCLTLVIFLTTLSFGLWPKGQATRNNTFWVVGEEGLQCNPPGIAYVDDLFISSREEMPQSFTVHVVFVPSNTEKSGFKPIFTLHDGNDRTQLSLWNWGRSLIIMNGDDYDYSRKEPRLSEGRLLQAGEQIVITVTSSVAGSKLYANGKLVSENQDLRLVVPQKGEKTRLVLGNSVHASHSWHGKIFHFALIPGAVSKDMVKQLFHNWIDEGTTKYDAFDSSSLVYRFIGDNAHWHRKDNGAALILPERVISLEKSILVLPWGKFRSSQVFWFDLVINLLGFIPAGAILSLLFYSYSLPEKKNYMYTLLICFTLSLFIELSQVWLIHRHSSLLDLILNTLGGAMGFLLGRRLKRTGAITS